MTDQVIFSAVAGATVAGLVAIFLSLLQGRREHRRWLREQRLDAYRSALHMTISFLEVLDLESFRAHHSDPSKVDADVVAKMSALSDKSNATLANLSLLGPTRVWGAFHGVAGAMFKKDRDALKSYQDVMIREMKKAVGV